jgi:hypothetical protein
MDRNEHIEELIAKEEIRTSFLRFCRALDTRNAPMAASVFMPEAIDHHPPLGEWTASEMEGRLATAFSTMFLESQYFAGFPVVEVLGETAKSETYVWCAKRTYDEDERGFRFQRLSGMVYFDEWARCDGVWLIADRRFVPVWEMFHSIGSEPRTVERNYKQPTPLGEDNVDPGMNYRAVSAAFWGRDE